MKIVPSSNRSSFMIDPKPTSYRVGDDPILRFCVFYAFLYVGSLMLGGVGIFLIIFGLMLLVTRVLARTAIGQMYIRRFFGFKEPEQILTPTRSRINKIVTTSIGLIVFGFYTFGSIFLIWMGIRFLINDGFLNQNLIYILFFKFK